MFFFFMIRLTPRSTRAYPLFPYTTLFRSGGAALGRHPLLEGGLVVLLVGAGVEAGEIVDDLLHAASVRIVDVGAQDVVVEEVAVAEHGGLAGLRQHDELVDEVAADRAGEIGRAHV